MTTIQVRGLTRRYGAVAAAFEVAFELPSGGSLALLGPRGCGKTTILRCLAGLETPDWGGIAIGGETVFDRDGHIDVPPERRGLGIVFRSHTVWPHMSVLDNVAFPLRARDVPLAERRERASAALELAGLKGFEVRPGALLSPEQQQRIALARALVHEPGLILFDDALARLDAEPRRQLRTDLRLLQERIGFTAIHATNDQPEAFALADQIILLNQGAIEAAGSAREMFRRPPTAYAARFFGMNIVEGLLVGPAADPRYLEVELNTRLVVRGVAAPDQDLVPGGRVLACIRKDAVRVLRATRPEEATGVIVAASFLGQNEEYLVDIAGVRLEAIGPAIGLARDDKVRVTMTPDDWVFLR